MFVAGFAKGFASAAVLDARAAGFVAALGGGGFFAGVFTGAIFFADFCGFATALCTGLDLLAGGFLATTSFFAALALGAAAFFFAAGAGDIGSDRD